MNKADDQNIINHYMTFQNQKLKRSVNHHKNSQTWTKKPHKKDTKFKYRILKYNFLNSHIDQKRKLLTKQRTSGFQVRTKSRSSKSKAKNKLNLRNNWKVQPFSINKKKKWAFFFLKKQMKEPKPRSWKNNLSLCSETGSENERSSPQNTP